MYLSFKTFFLSQITPRTNNGTWCLFSICPFLYHSHQTITIKFHNIFLLLLFYTTYLFHPPNFLSILSILLSYPTYLIHPPTGIRNITHTWRTHMCGSRIAMQHLWNLCNTCLTYTSCRIGSHHIHFVYCHTF